MQSTSFMGNLISYEVDRTTYQKKYEVDKTNMVDSCSVPTWPILYGSSIWNSEDINFPADHEAPSFNIN